MYTVPSRVAILGICRVWVSIPYTDTRTWVLWGEVECSDCASSGRLKHGLNIRDPIQAQKRSQ